MSFITNFYNWPVQDLSAVATAQTVAAGSNLTLNGTLVNASIAAGLTPYGSIDFPGISRTVVITLSGTGSASFTIKGLRNNGYVEETVVISSATTVTSTNFFDTVTSISSSTGTAALTAQVGTGLVGCTRPFIPNSFITQTPVDTVIHTKLIAGTVSYNVIGSIEKWSNTSMSTGSITSPEPLYLNEVLVNSTSGQYLSATPATASSLITVSDLPLTMVCINITVSVAATALTVRITSPRIKG